MNSNRIEPTISLGGTTSGASVRFNNASAPSDENLRLYPLAPLQIRDPIHGTTSSNADAANNLSHYPLAPVGSGDPVLVGAPASRSSNPEENLRHYPVAPAGSYDQAPLASVNEKVLFQKRLVANYPAKYVMYLSLAILALNIMMLYCELSLNQLRYYKYHTTFVAKYAVITSIGNNIYALLALFSSKLFLFCFFFDFKNVISKMIFSFSEYSAKFRSYFLIQLMSLLHLVGFFGTAFFPVFLNIFSFILSALEGSCVGRCLLIEAITIIAAFVSAIFSMAMFVKIQFNFLANLNRNSFANGIYI